MCSKNSFHGKNLVASCGAKSGLESRGKSMFKWIKMTWYYHHDNMTAWWQLSFMGWQLYQRHQDCNYSCMNRSISTMFGCNDVAKKHSLSSCFARMIFLICTQRNRARFALKPNKTCWKIIWISKEKTKKVFSFEIQIVFLQVLFGFKAKLARFLWTD